MKLVRHFCGHVTFFRVQLANADLMVQYVQSKETLEGPENGSKTLKC